MLTKAETESANVKAQAQTSPSPTTSDAYPSERATTTTASSRVR